MPNPIIPIVCSLIVLILSVACMFLGSMLEAIYLAVLWVGMTNNIGVVMRNG